MSSFDKRNSQYYQPVEQTPAAGTVLAAVASVVAAAAAGAVYAEVERNSPLIYLNLLLVILWGWMIGTTTSAIGRTFRLRSTAAIIRISWLAAAASFFFAWITWLAAFVTMYGDQPVSLEWLLCHPSAWWDVLLWANRHGTWGVGHYPLPFTSEAVTSLPLLLVWVGEAVAFFGVARLVAARKAVMSPYCQRCGRWYGSPDRIHSYDPGLSGEEIKQHLEAGDFPFLGTLPRSSARKTQRLDLEVQRCPQCPDTLLLSLRRVSNEHVSAPNMGPGPLGIFGGLIFGARPTEHGIVIVNRLRITEKQLALIKSLQPIEPLEERPAAASPADDYVDLGL